MTAAPAPLAPHGAAGMAMTSESGLAAPEQRGEHALG